METWSGCSKHKLVREGCIDCWCPPGKPVFEKSHASVVRQAAITELKGLNKQYKALLDRHNALCALDACCCNCDFCDDAGALFNNGYRPCGDLYSCKACDEITLSKEYEEQTERKEALIRVIKTTDK